MTAARALEAHKGIYKDKDTFQVRGVAIEGLSRKLA
jgi:hypothetical protein